MTTNQFILEGDLTVATPVGPKRWFRPIPTEPFYYAYRQMFRQFEKDFRPAVGYPKESVYEIGSATQNKPFTTAAHRCVEEGELNPIGNGIIDWERTYMRTPKAHFVESSFNWRMPGIQTGDADILDINAATSSQGGAVTTIVTTAVHGASVGDFVSISYVAVVAGSGGGVLRSVLKEVLTTPNTSSMTVGKVVDNIQLTTGGDPDWRNVIVGASRQPRLETVASKVAHEYYTIGENITKPDDIPSIGVEIILDGTGLEVDSYSTTTLPLADDYRARIGEWIVADNSFYEPFFGPIYVRKTRYVIAK